MGKLFLGCFNLVWSVTRKIKWVQSRHSGCWRKENWFLKKNPKPSQSLALSFLKSACEPINSGIHQEKSFQFLNSVLWTILGDLDWIWVSVDRYRTDWQAVGLFSKSKIFQTQTEHEEKSPAYSFLNKLLSIHSTDVPLRRTWLKSEQDEKTKSEVLFFQPCTCSDHSRRSYSLGSSLW